jgi:hypothetical protein
LCQLVLLAQKIPVTAISSNTYATTTPEGLTEELDQASSTSQLYYHAKAYPVNEFLSADHQKIDGFYYKISATHLAIKVFLNIGGMPPGDTLFMLNKTGQRTEAIHSGNFYDSNWSSHVYKDEVVLFYKNEVNSLPKVEISSYSLELQQSQKGTDDFGDSGPCEVNVNCSEGDAYDPVKKGVARILVKNGSFLSWCSGTLVNNTARDCRLLFMTAEHCGLQGNFFATDADVSRWEFDFNYEAPGCANISSPSQITNPQKITGAKVLARSNDGGGDDGSDFILLELTGNLPPDFEPYFVGWNRVNSGSQKGVVIHHPQGDVKKISTYTNQAFSGEYGITNMDTHWLVNWAKTTNGHGVTEGGSSGSALLDANGQITGMLTGGSATCNAPQEFDYFGKLSYSWQSNGTASNRQLAPWLDPANTGELAIAGIFCGDSIDFNPQPPYIVPTLLNSDDILFVKGGSSANLIDVQIFDVQGKLRLRTEEFAPLASVPREIMVDKLASGIYFVRVVGIGINEVTKIVIAN